MAVALLIGGIYLFASDTWLAISTDLAAQWAPDKTDLEVIVFIKGLVNALIMAGGLVGLLYPLFRQIAADGKLHRQEEEALLAAERRAMAGVLSLSVVHDCNNLLTIAQGYSELLLRKEPQLDEGVSNALKRLTNSLEQLTLASSRMLTMGRRSVATTAMKLDLSSFVRESLILVRSHEQVRSCELEFFERGPVPTVLVPAMVHDTVLNLVLNAAEACGAKGTIQVRVEACEQWSILEVHDNGPGVSREDRQRIFETFYTTKKAGSGLGLVSVRACVDAHEGHITVARSPLGGALFRIELPREAVRLDAPGRAASGGTGVAEA
ncbi:MAG TPA: HAMP domain-containing sensor histidine kinase [bacterium]|nr:HAMP domain-containing sensor histidine kinase [bacterium]